MKWIKRKLVEVCNPKQWKNLPISELTEVGYSVYGANGIIGKYKEYNHESPTIAITCRGATCGSVHITQPKSYITSNAMALDDLVKDVHQKFLYYTLTKRSFKDVISGSAQPQITREGLSKIELNLPEELEDQIRIADILSKAEALISQRKESLRLLDEVLKSTFLEMFGQSLLQKKSELSEVATVVSGLTKGKKYENKKTIFVPYMRVANVQDGYLDLNEIKEIEATADEIERYHLENGDLLLTEGGDPDKLGRGAIWRGVISDCIYQNHIFRVRANRKIINPVFLSFLTASAYGKEYFLKAAKQTTGIASINSTQLKQFPVIIPKLPKQNQFADIVQKTEALKAHYQTSLQELENLYDSLSQKAFKGELNLKGEGLAIKVEPRARKKSITQR